MPVAIRLLNNTWSVCVRAHVCLCHGECVWLCHGVCVCAMVCVWYCFNCCVWYFNCFNYIYLVKVRLFCWWCCVYCIVLLRIIILRAHHDHNIIAPCGKWVFLLNFWNLINVNKRKVWLIWRKRPFMTLRKINWFQAVNYIVRPPI